MQPCLLICGQDQALEYMKAVYSQPHAEVLDMWTCLQCFCREPATLQQSHSTQNPDRLFLNCSKKHVWLLPVGRSTLGSQVLELVS